MSKTMTVWMTNGALVFLTMMMLVLPKPREITEAFRTQTDAPHVQIEPDGTAVELVAVQSTKPEPVVAVVNYARATECLRAFQDQGLQGVENCTDDLTAAILRFDHSAAVRAEDGRVVTPNPQIEAMRLAVTKLCRAKWAAVGSPSNGPEMAVCDSVMEGLAY